MVTTTTTVIIMMTLIPHPKPIVMLIVKLKYVMLPVNVNLQPILNNKNPYWEFLILIESYYL